MCSCEPAVCLVLILIPFPALRMRLILRAWHPVRAPPSRQVPTSLGMSVRELCSLPCQSQLQMSLRVASAMMVLHSALCQISRSCLTTKRQGHFGLIWSPKNSVIGDYTLLFLIGRLIGILQRLWDHEADVYIVARLINTSNFSILTVRISRSVSEPNES